MSIDTKAVIFIGLRRGDFEDDEQLREWLDNEDLETASPRYDGNSEEHTVVGLCVAASGNYNAREIYLDMDVIGDMMAEFKGLTGKEAKLWLSPHIT